MTVSINEQTLKKVQALTGIGIFVFLAVHLINLLLGFGGADFYNNFQSVAQSIYQFPPLELLLIAVLIPLHIVSGLLRAKRRPANAKTPANLRAHRIAGLFLAIVIVGHIAAVRGPSLLLDIYPGFEGVSFTLNYLPQIFYPYYFLLAVAGAYHGAYGLSLALQRMGLKRKLPLPNRGVLTGLSIAVALSLLAIGGVLIDTPDPFSSAFAKFYLNFIDVSLR